MQNLDIVLSVTVALTLQIAGIMLSLTYYRKWRAMQRRHRRVLRMLHQYELTMFGRQSKEAENIVQFHPVAKPAEV